MFDDLNKKLTPYEMWLSDKKFPLYKGGGRLWSLYHGALVPAQATVCYPEITDEEARIMLRMSGAMFIRYTRKSSVDKGPWWWIVCDHHDPMCLPPKIRSMVRRGFRECKVERTNAFWLADNAYTCYCAAFKRYTHAKPVSLDRFRNGLILKASGPFEYWAVFVGGELAGYAECIIESNQVTTNVIKFHSDFLKYYTSYALITSLVEHYVSHEKMKLDNGNRTILHDTNVQDFLIKLGFHKEFGELVITYRPSVFCVVKMVNFLKPVLTVFKNITLISKLLSLGYQEEIRKLSSMPR